MPNRPNFLVILSDQHSPHVLGCAGDAVVRTPNLDRLAAAGVIFDAAYCGSPLCVPSRMTFLTARHCSDIRVWTNGCILASDIPTFAHGLGAAGWETVLGGRMHFVGPDQRHGFEHRILGDVLSPLPGGPPPDLGHIPMGTTGAGRVSVEFSGPGRTAYQAYDDAVTEACCRFLEERDAGRAERPFCLVAGFVLPHCPFICPLDLYEEYHDRIDLPELTRDYLDRQHPAVRHRRKQCDVDELDEATIRRSRAAYYGLVTHLDERIGRLLETLSATYFQDNTVVVYISDHGEMAGEQGLWWKCTYYEGSVRVPMIRSWPGHFAEGRRLSPVVSLLDVGPTLLDLAGSEPLPGAAGRSLKEFLGGGTVSGWPDETFSELGGGRVGYSRMIRRGPWKLACYHGYAEPQLFNLKEDPDERVDRAGDPGCASVKAELLARVLSGWDPEAVTAHLQGRAAGTQTLRRWGQTVAHDLSDFWRAPAGCNVFPEE